MVRRRHGSRQRSLPAPDSGLVLCHRAAALRRLEHRQSAHRQDPVGGTRRGRRHRHRNQASPALDSQTIVTQLESRGLPIGWAKGWDTSGAAGQLIWVIVAALAGWLISATATIYGAPFWFDMLQKVTRLAGTGPPPRRSPGKGLDQRGRYGSPQSGRGRLRRIGQDHDAAVLALRPELVVVPPEGSVGADDRRLLAVGTAALDHGQGPIVR